MSLCESPLTQLIEETAHGSCHSSTASQQHMRGLSLRLCGVKPIFKKLAGTTAMKMFTKVEWFLFYRDTATLLPEAFQDV